MRIATYSIVSRSMRSRSHTPLQGGEKGFTTWSLSLWSSTQPTHCTPRHNELRGLGTSLPPSQLSTRPTPPTQSVSQKCGSYYVQMCCKEIGYLSRIYVLGYVFSLCAVRFARNINFQCNSIRGITKLRPVLIKFGNKDYKRKYRQNIQYNKSIKRAI